MVFSPDDVLQWLNQLLLPFFRVAAFFMVVPIFGNQLVALRVRVLFALTCAIALYATLPEIPVVDPLSAEMVVMVFQQIMIGAMLGFLVQIFFHIFVLAGQMVAMQMGLGFASMIDPTNGVSVAVVSQFYVLLEPCCFWHSMGTWC